MLALSCAVACDEPDGADEEGSSSGGTNAAVGGLPGTGGESADDGGMPATSGGTNAISSGGSTATGGTDAFGGSGPEGGQLHPGSPPSCEGFDGAECAGGDCCASLLVPGGVVEVDGTEQTLPSFYLDKYEVTVARFRQYMHALEAWTAAGNPADGAGAHPLVPESGWRSDWLEVTGEEGEEDVALLELYEPFTDPDTVTIYEPPTYPISGADQLPVNFTTFHAAFAFCIWDGGRLPAKAEWLYAAHGGDAHTALPWGDAPPLNVVFAEIPEATVPEPRPDTNLWEFVGIPVGSHPDGASRFGHEDLIGGWVEFVRDTSEGSLTPGELIELDRDEVVHGVLWFGDDYSRSAIGLSWDDVAFPSNWDTGHPANDTPTGSVGIRCARDP